MRAIGYLRRSVSKDPTREVSREVQTDAIRALAKRHGHELPDASLYVDWGLSGRTGTRPEYQRMIAAIEAGEVDALYAYSLSRLGRSVAQLASLIQLCGAKGTAVRLVVDSVDTSTASGRMMASILGSVAEFESDVASERARAATAIRVERGERIGRPFYGEGTTDNPEAVVQAFRDAGSYSGAARLLNERGVKPRDSAVGKWWPSSVQHIVRRVAPGEVPPLQRRGARTRQAHRFAGLLLCPAPECAPQGVILTASTETRHGTIKRTRYLCRYGAFRQHERVAVSEHKILPAIKREVARLHVPGATEDVIAADAAALADIEVRRARLVALAESGLALDIVRSRMVALDAEATAIGTRTALVEVPSLDWDWAPADINAVMRSMLDGIVLDPATLRPIAYRWREGLGDWLQPET